ncbi:bacteriocin-like protein [Chryseobacterium wanjuense]
MKNLRKIERKNLREVHGAEFNSCISV